ARQAQLERGPLRPPPGRRGIVEKVAELANPSLYPEQAYSSFRALVAAWAGTDAEMVLPAHGIQALVLATVAVFVNPGDKAEWSDFIENLPYGCQAVVDEAYADYMAPAERPPGSTR
ncbi:MAG: hypothetical protein M0T79_00460, partial [Actinomycetota bacterium]|nr:hypothetical protein [Actinomycetota bacterium]